MNASTSEIPDATVVPQARHAAWIERLIWVFMMSFAFDYRAEEQGSGSGGMGIDQLLFLATCGGSSLGIMLLGWRSLMIRPGAWLIAFWGIFVAFMLVNSLAQGVQLGRSLRVILPLVFCLFGMMNAHIASCAGIRPSRIVVPILTAACINVLWRIFHGFAFKHVTLESVRIEVLSPINDWLAAWIACAILFRKRFRWDILLACAVLFIGAFITVTRSLIFPIAMAVVAGSGCFLLGVRWGIYQASSFLKIILPIAAVGLFSLVALATVALLQPLMIERWTERLFHDVDARNISVDISYLTRRAEADAMWKLLMENPAKLINGRGIGSSYYWDSAYLSEIHMVIPEKGLEVNDIWFAGHSIWTYNLFSGGIIAVAAIITLISATAILSLRAARVNASSPGPDQWLAFLPFIYVCCLMSLSLTANPFQERLVGIFFGMMVALPQAFFVRASWIHTTPPPISPRLD
jgi:hypothetical protein